MSLRLNSQFGIFRRYTVLAIAALCAFSLPVYAENIETDLTPGWDALGRDLIHRMVGDDLHAFFGFSPKLSVIPNVAPTAFADASGELIVSSGLLPLLRSPSEYAFVLAHELGHIMLGHSKNTLKNESIPSLIGAGKIDLLVEHELEADRFALKLLRQGQFNLADAMMLLARIGSLGAEYGMPFDAINPGLRVRRNAIQSELEK